MHIKTTDAQAQHTFFYELNNKKIQRTKQNNSTANTIQGNVEHK